LWPERVRIALSAGGAPGVNAALATLRAKSAAVEITLSNRLVRYLCLPWSPALRTEADWRSFAEHRFAELFGPRPKGYAVLLSSPAARAPRLACALEREALETMRSSVAAAGHRLAGLRPRFAVSFDRAHRRIGKGDAWFVDQEPGYLTLGLASGGEWRAIRQRHADAAWDERLAQVLDREGELAGAGAIDRAFVVASERAEELPPRAGRYTLFAMGAA